jgi:hypothetical protein
MQGGAPRGLHFVFNRGFTTILLFGGLGVEDEKWNGYYKVLTLHHAIFFWRVGTVSS